MLEILSVADRALMAFEAVVKRDAELHAESSDRYGITDDGVVDVIHEFTTGTCGSLADQTGVGDGCCTSDTCCDYQRLSALVWTLVEQAYSCNCEES